MKVLGIDPGTTTVGYAILSDDNGNLEIESYGIIETTPKLDLKFKILDIGKDIAELIESFNPEIVSIEKLYFTNNIKTGIDVAQARGVMLYEAVKKGITILEYTPLEVKSAITGYGKANKKQLQNAIKMLFKMQEIPKPDDAADAIGLAYMGYLNKNHLNFTKN